MSSYQDGPPEGSPRESIIAAGPPYPPHTQGLGGNPDMIPDVPISAIFLALYLVFGIIHIKIFKNNKSRGHKFIFNGAVLGLCKIRIVTMSLRMAWASYPRNTSLAIAANVFVYVGTIIIFMINWFFVQRIIRAQHARLGWSTPYRIFHRLGLALLITTLIMLIIANIWQFFTLDDYKRHVFKILILISQTYFTVFAFAPAIMVAISLVIPRREIEKFGAGRLRINIMILLLAVGVISVGQIFRCVINWIPQTPMRGPSGRPIDTPWYLSKACFYCFNFVTEIIVIILFAVVRVDLRFHIPNGSRMSGDYSLRNSRVTLASSNEKDGGAPGPVVRMTCHRNNSTETLHQYKNSVFDDTHTLADSLRFGSSTLEVDEKTGHWKVKRVSTGSTTSRAESRISFNSSDASQSSPYERTVRFDDEDSAPPVPSIPSEREWPLPDTPVSRKSQALMEHNNPATKRSNLSREFELPGQAMNGRDMNEAVTDALASLEYNSSRNSSAVTTPITPVNARTVPPHPPPQYKDIGRIGLGANAPLVNQARKTPVIKNPLAPRIRSTYPPKSALKTSRHNSGSSTPRDTPTIQEAPELPEVSATAATKPRHDRSSSLEIVTVSQCPSSDSRRILEKSLQCDNVNVASEMNSGQSTFGAHGSNNTIHLTDIVRAPLSGYSHDIDLAGISRDASAKSSNETTSSDARENAMAHDAFKHFSFEGDPVSPLTEEEQTLQY